MLNISKDEKRYSEIELDLQKKLAYEKGRASIIEEFKNQKTGHWIRWYETVEHKTCTENIPHCKCSECNKEYNPYTSNFIK